MNSMFRRTKRIPDLDELTRQAPEGASHLVCDRNYAVDSIGKRMTRVIPIGWLIGGVLVREDLHEHTLLVKPEVADHALGQHNLGYLVTVRNDRPRITTQKNITP